MNKFHNRSMVSIFLISTSGRNIFIQGGANISKIVYLDHEAFFPYFVSNAEYVFPFRGGNRVLAHCNTYSQAIHMSVSQSARNIRKCFCPAMRSISSTNLLRECFFRPVTAMVYQ